MMGQMDRAIDDFNAAIRPNPDHSRPIHTPGSRMGKKRDFNRAIADFSDAIQRDPSRAFFTVTAPASSFCPNASYCDSALTTRERLLRPVSGRAPRSERPVRVGLFLTHSRYKSPTRCHWVQATTRSGTRTCPWSRAPKNAAAAQATQPIQVPMIIGLANPVPKRSARNVSTNGTKPPKIAAWWRKALAVARISVGSAR
jgi:hypothetical protein